MIRFGVVGCGMIGRLHAEVIFRNPEMRLEAVYDRNTSAAEKLGAQYGCDAAESLEALLDRVDAVAVCLPSDLHAAAVYAAARKGKHVVCEKPVAARMEEAAEMIRLCRENGVLLSVIFQHRFDAAVRAVKHAIESGEMGRVLWASCRSILYREESYFTSVPWHAQFGSGALMNQSIHYIDLMLYLLGNPASVTGHCRTLLHRANDNEDIGLAIVNFESGAPAVIEGTTAAYPGLYNELAVYGESGTFIIRNDELFSYKLKSGNKPEYDALLNPYAVYTANRDAKIDIGAHAMQYENIAGAILGREKLLVTGEEGLRSVELITAIYESSNKNAPVRLQRT